MFLKIFSFFFTQEFQIIHKNTNFFSFFITHLSSSSLFIYNIVINTPTTTNNQFQALNEPKSAPTSSYTHFLYKQTISLSFSLLFHLKIPIFHFIIYNLVKVTQVHDSWSKNEWVTFIMKLYVMV